MSAQFDIAEASLLLAEVRAKLTFIESLASAARDMHAARADDHHDQATESVFEAISEAATSVLNGSEDCPLARLGRSMSPAKQPSAFIAEPGFTPMYQEDVAGLFASASDTFGQLAALFVALKTANESERVKLIELGEAVASDYEDMADGWREQAQKGGVQ